MFQVRKNFFPPRPRRKNKKLQNRLRKRKSDGSDNVGGMSKVRKQDDMGDVTSARISEDKPSSSGSFNDASDHETKRNKLQDVFPGMHSESDSLSSSQETVIMCSKTCLLYTSRCV